MPVRFLPVLILTPQHTGDTHSFSIFRLHSTGSLHLWLRKLLSQLSSPSLKGRQTVTHSGEGVFGLFSILPALKLKRAGQEISALLDIPTTIPCLSLMSVKLRGGQWGSLLRQTASAACWTWVPECRSISLSSHWHMETTADSVSLVLVRCTSHFSWPYPFSWALTQVKANEKEDEERAKIPLVSRTPRNSKLLRPAHIQHLKI